MPPKRNFDYSLYNYKYRYEIERAERAESSFIRLISSIKNHICSAYPMSLEKIEGLDVVKDCFLKSIRVNGSEDSVEMLHLLMKSIRSHLLKFHVDDELLLDHHELNSIHSTKPITYKRENVRKAYFETELRRFLGNDERETLDWIRAIGESAHYKRHSY